MRIIYCTDIHGAFERVRELLYETIADVYIISGDLIDIPFYNMDSAIRYYELQMYFDTMRKQMGRDDVTVEDFVDELLEMPHITEDVAELGTKFQQYTIRARRVMQQKYKVLANIFSFKPQTYIFALPGNYDMDLKYTSLHDRDLHMHWYLVEDQVIAGYGGADVFTAGIPQKYVVPYRAGIGIDDRKNEMYNFFKAVRPTIIVTHQPAHGVLDWLAPVGPTGSPALRTYCDNNPVILCLTGHIHGSWGIQEVEHTLYLNPSPFGDITTVRHDVLEGGFFYQIELEEGKVVQVLYRKMYNERVYDLAEYVKKDGMWAETIIDEGRFNAKKKLHNIDMNIQQYSHIPEIELFKEIKNFFRMFQTEESELRVEKLEEIVKRIEPMIEDIAMDVVGSVNVGLSQPSSDIDIVLYLRCGLQCTDNPLSCNCCKDAAEMIRNALQDEYKFEVLDCIDLNEVERSIKEKNYESETLQRFVAYRSICRPINYRVIAPLEDMLNQDIEFRKEVEGSIRSYFKIFVTTSQHIRSFKKYENRLKTIGIRLPDSIRRKILQYLQSEEDKEF
ncbi:MAG: metallophosphoesterase [Spirochaetes bacterium]|nr:metallophosphoesterase [Spirochaetota bacterium]